jgi:uncharacterized protein YjiK
MRLLVLFLFSFSFISAQKIKPVKLKPESVHNLKIPEPSDVCLSADGNHLYIVSDNGYLYKTDKNGKILQKATFTGIDFEGVYATETTVFVSDEAVRKIHHFSADDLSFQKSAIVSYQGGRNKGFESITYHQQRNVFVLVTEKDPILIREYDADFKLKAEYPFKHTRDISAATWHDNHIWFLSDEDRLIMKLNPKNYEVLASWKIPVINPEGIAFVDDKLIILSDDLEKMYVFPQPK